MRNTARKGNGAELRTAKLLEADGWIVASRRHVGGAGDLLAVKAGEVPRLIEVKACQQIWQNFRRDDRAELVECAKRAGAVPELAWWPPRLGAPLFSGPADWPV